jgi:hypothetical protein
MNYSHLKVMEVSVNQSIRNFMKRRIKALGKRRRKKEEKNLS